MTAIFEKVCAVKAVLRSRAFAVSVISFVLVVVGIFMAANAGHAFGAAGSAKPINTNVRESVAAMPEMFPVQISGGYVPIRPQYTQLSAAPGLTAKATVTVDGDTSVFHVKKGTTVGELLEEQEIEIGEHDLVVPSLNREIRDGENIAVCRVTYEDFTQDAVMPFEVIYKPSPLLKTGETKLLQEGAIGQKTLNCVRRLVDGEEEETHIIGETVHTQPIDEIHLVGEQVPVSDLDFDVELDENGKPVDYVRVMTQQVSTGYSARPGALTASGRYAVTGHVAVNPNEIPYGTKLYITSSDNSFVYGYAVAADTGTGLLADVVDIDLFYDTYTESALNGRKYLDVYILE